MDGRARTIVGFLLAVHVVYVGVAAEETDTATSLKSLGVLLGPVAHSSGRVSSPGVNKPRRQPQGIDESLGPLA